MGSPKGEKNKRKKEQKLFPLIRDCKPPRNYERIEGSLNKGIPTQILKEGRILNPSCEGKQPRRKHPEKQRMSYFQRSPLGDEKNNTTYKLHKLYEGLRKKFINFS